VAAIMRGAGITLCSARGARRPDLRQFLTFELDRLGDADVRGRWIPTRSIDQYGVTLCSWIGIPEGALSTVFPNFANFGPEKTWLWDRREKSAPFGRGSVLIAWAGANF